jgi:hypothetical protein
MQALLRQVLFQNCAIAHIQGRWQVRGHSKTQSHRLKDALLLRTVGILLLLSCSSDQDLLD